MHNCARECFGLRVIIPHPCAQRLRDNGWHLHEEARIWEGPSGQITSKESIDDLSRHPDPSIPDCYITAMLASGPFTHISVQSKLTNGRHTYWVEAVEP